MSTQEFTHIIQPIKDKLFRFALRMVKSAEEAEDIVQEVFIKVWNRRDRLDQLQNLEAWCMTLTKNLSIDKMRSKHRFTSDIETTYGLEAPMATPEKQAVLNDALSHVHQIMNKDLSDHQRTAIQLRDIEGLTYKEIGKIMDISIDMVKTNIFRGRKKIKDTLLKNEKYGL